MQRAEELAREAKATKEILTFYARLLQKEVDEFLRSRPGWRASGSLSEDLRLVRECATVVLRTASEWSGATGRRGARCHVYAPSVDEMPLEYGNSPSDTQFFAKAILHLNNSPLY
jgi:hypothetical protein